MAEKIINDKNSNDKNFANSKKIYFLGICGTLTASFAVALQDMGYEVMGSDTGVYPPMSDYLANAGVKVLQGYDEKNILEHKADIYIIGNVIRRTNPEAECVVKNNFKYYSLPSALKEVKLCKTKNFVVAGTHGKTTTSAILSFIMDRNNCDPSYFIGGATLDFDRSLKITNSDVFVLEGDEYDTAFFDKVPKFIHYNPSTSIITSVEFDHADIYKDLDDVKNAFKKLVDLTPQNGLIIASSDEANVLEVIKNAKCKVITYGESSQANYQIVNYSEINNSFVIKENIGEKREFQVKTPLAGAYNAANFTASFVAAINHGLNPVSVIKSFENFKGVKRRQEIRAIVNNITVIDDFAHHPTAVLKTLKGLRAKYSIDKNKKLIAVFEPRSATSRRAIFQKDYANAFEFADMVYIAKPYDQSLIDEKDRFSTEQLISDIKTKGKNAEILNPEKSKRASHVLSNASAGDVVAILSNGGFDGLIPEIISELKAKFEK